MAIPAIALGETVVTTAPLIGEAIADVVPEATAVIGEVDPGAAAAVDEAAGTVSSAATSAAKSILPDSITTRLGIGTESTAAKEASAVLGTTAEEATPAVETSALETDAEPTAPSADEKGLLDKFLSQDKLTLIVNLMALGSIAGPLVIPFVKDGIVKLLGQSKGDKSLIWANRILNTAAAILELDNGSTNARQLAASFRNMATSVDPSKEPAEPTEENKAAVEKIKKDPQFEDKFVDGLKLAKSVVLAAKEEGFVKEENPQGEQPDVKDPPKYIILKVPSNIQVENIFKSLNASGAAEPHVGGCQNMLADAMVPDWTGQMVGRVPLLFIQVALFVVLVLIMILLLEMDWKQALISGYIGASAGTLGVLAVCYSGSPTTYTPQ